MKYVDFTGEETEIEFLKKCYEQWLLTVNEGSPFQQLMQTSIVFHEIEHRIEELEGDSQ